jgi:hypothetical protein
MKHILVIISLLLLSGLGFSQTIGDVQMDEKSFYAMTKQMGQFMRRFNYEEDQFGERLNPKSKEFRNNTMRRKSLPILFNQTELPATPELRQFFIEDVTKNDSNYMTFLGGRWYSEVTATFSYKGKEVKVLMVLSIEREGLGSKWVLTNVYFPEFNKLFPKGEIAEKEKHFLHPMSHELDFMNIHKVFQTPEVIEYYASSDFQPDYLTLFFYEVKKKNLVFKKVDGLKFHVFQIKDWYFEVSWFNNSGNNSGWLMSNLIYMPEKDKTEIIKFYQP